MIYITSFPFYLDQEIKDTQINRTNNNYAGVKIEFSYLIWKGFVEHLKALVVVSKGILSWESG